MKKQIEPGDISVDNSVQFATIGQVDDLSVEDESRNDRYASAFLNRSSLPSIKVRSRSRAQNGSQVSGTTGRSFSTLRPKSKKLRNVRFSLAHRSRRSLEEEEDAIRESVQQEYFRRDLGNMEQIERRRQLRKGLQTLNDSCVE